MTMSPATRREILRRATALSCVGAAASTFGFQLATMGNAAAQTAPTYKALVCIFMFGGNDAQQHGAGHRHRQLEPLLAARNHGAEPDRACCAAARRRRSPGHRPRRNTARSRSLGRRAADRARHSTVPPGTNAPCARSPSTRTWARCDLFSSRPPRGRSPTSAR